MREFDNKEFSPHVNGIPLSQIEKIQNDYSYEAIGEHINNLISKKESSTKKRTDVSDCLNINLPVIDEEKVRWVHESCDLNQVYTEDGTGQVNDCLISLDPSVESQLEANSNNMEWKCSPFRNETIELSPNFNNGYSDVILLAQNGETVFTAGDTFVSAYNTLWELPKLIHSMQCSKRNIKTPIFCSTANYVSVTEFVHVLRFETSFPAPIVNKKTLYRIYEDYGFLNDENIIIGLIEPYTSINRPRPECSLIKANVFKEVYRESVSLRFVTDMTLEYTWYPDYYCCSGTEDPPQEVLDPSMSPCCQGETLYESITNYDCGSNESIQSSQSSYDDILSEDSNSYDYFNDTETEEKLDSSTSKIVPNFINLLNL